MGTESHQLRTRRSSRLLRSQEVHAELAERGFAVVGPVADDATLDALRTLYRDSVRPLHQGEASWFSTGGARDAAARRAVFAATGTLIRPLIEALVTDESRVMAGHFHVNPDGGVGGLGPHQDITLVDEAEWSSINGWLPLDDSDVGNGTIRFVPGSHRFGNSDRSLALDWSYDGLHELFWRFAEPVEVPRGHLVVFDTATVHCSGPNTSGSDRAAVNCLITPAAAALRHLVGVGEPATRVEVYSVDEQFFLDGDLFGRPDERYRLIDERPVHRPVACHDSVLELCEAGQAL